jgi:hypothetical protein
VSVAGLGTFFCPAALGPESLQSAALLAGPSASDELAPLLVHAGPFAQTTACFVTAAAARAFAARFLQAPLVRQAALLTLHAPCCPEAPVEVRW